VPYIQASTRHRLRVMCLLALVSCGCQRVAPPTSNTSPLLPRPASGSAPEPHGSVLAAPPAGTASAPARSHGPLPPCYSRVVRAADGSTRRRQSNYDMPPYSDLNARERRDFALGASAFALGGQGHGLGPVANGTACTTCHVNPIGGSSNIRVTRFGRTGPHGYDPLTARGGPLLHTRSDAGCTAETLPSEATVTAIRRTPQLYGLGLVEAIPDAAILAEAQAQARQHPGQRGRALVVTSPSDHRTHVGRFGFKCQHGTLRDAVADALVNELGVSNAVFAFEPQPHSAPRKVAATDLEDRPDQAGRTRVERDTDFVRLLAPLPRVPLRPRGLRLFAAVGCAVCHHPSYPTHSPLQALARQQAAFYSDFLLHDIGTGDGIEQAGARGTEMRTAPLAGVAMQPFFFHDGSARTVAEAVARHDRQAAEARHAFEALSGEEQHQLLDFVQSL
jgi:CxxC motif-containing protein (DUF1111 family)